MTVNTQKESKAMHHADPARRTTEGAPRVEVDGPGRTCPLHYQYGPSVFSTRPDESLAELEVLYVVGGLYGNELALEEVLRLFDREQGRKRLVFNGDFHWFDVEPKTFERVQREVLAHTAIRGNVETELADEEATQDAGCGCAYPDWVGDAVVERSNRILNRLRGVTTAKLRRELAALPMWQLASVGSMRIGLVHGDAQSLAGWGFAQEHLRDPSHLKVVQAWFTQAQVDVFASTHTCLPVFQKINAVSQSGPCWVLNNGAAGMPNFRGDSAGLLTRIASRPFEGPQRRLGLMQNGIYMDAVAIQTDPAQALRRFLHQWPEGTDAHASYFSRILAGPAYTADQVIRQEN
jgi:predicted phosphodiesterase